MQVPTVRVKDGKGSKVINREDYDADSNAYELMEDIGIVAQPEPEPEVEEDVVEETPEAEAADAGPEAPVEAPAAETIEADGTKELKTEEDLGVLTIPELTARLEAAGVDIETIVGTGSNDRVVKLDLVNAVKAAAEAAQE